MPIKSLCLIAELAFASLPSALQPMICQGESVVTLMPNDLTIFSGDIPAEWVAVVDARGRRVVAAEFNGRKLLIAKPPRPRLSAPHTIPATPSPVSNATTSPADDLIVTGPR